MLILFLMSIEEDLPKFENADPLLGQKFSILIDVESGKMRVSNR